VTRVGRRERERAEAVAAAFEQMRLDRHLVAAGGFDQGDALAD